MVLSHIAWLLIGAAIGWAFDATSAGIAIVAVAALARQIYYQLRLHQSLPDSQSASELPGRNDWPGVLRKIRQLRENAAKSRKKHRKLLSRWRSVTDALPDAGLLLDDACNIVQANAKARETLGLDGNADSGRPVTDVIRHPDFVAAIDERRINEPVQFSPAGATNRTLSSVMTRFGKGQHLLMIRDVTEQVRAGKIKTDFVANASHELRTPLTVLKGYLTGLGEDPALDEIWREPVAEMIHHVDLMQALVSDLLRLNQLESQDDASMDSIDVADILDGGCKAARRLGDDIATIRLADCSPRMLRGDASALRSVVGNLLTNATRFTPADGEIIARWEADDAGGRLSISDTGIGISAGDIARVTERFYRTGPGRDRHQGGTGLGLAIVKHALAMHKAWLEIRSKPGDGSTFICHFPGYRIAPEDI